MTKLRIALWAGGAILLSLIVGSYIHSREVSLRADTEHQANQELQQQLQKMKEDFDKQIADRDAQWHKDSQDLNNKFDQANKSVLQSLALLTQLMKLPQPVTTYTPAPTKENPNPAPVAAVPQPDLPAVVAYAKDCEQCKLDRAKSQADLTDRQKQQALAEKQIEQLKKENTDILKASKGTFWSNVKKSAKWLFFGAVAGSAALCGTGHCK